MPDVDQAARLQMRSTGPQTRVCGTIAVPLLTAYHSVKRPFARE